MATVEATEPTSLRGATHLERRHITSLQTQLEADLEKITLLQKDEQWISQYAGKEGIKPNKQRIAFHKQLNKLQAAIKQTMDSPWMSVALSGGRGEQAQQFAAAAGSKRGRPKKEATAGASTSDGNTPAAN